MSQTHPRPGAADRPGQPRLHPRRPPLRRGTDEVQLGVGPQALVLRGLSAGQVAVLDRLDGSRSRAQLHELAAQHGDPPQAVDELLALLRNVGAMADPGSERVERLGRWRTTQRPVLVGGPPALTERLARALRQASVDDVLVGAWALDHAELTLRDPRGTVTARPRTPHLVILSAHDGIDPAEAAPWVRHGVPHLAVITEGDRVVVGPLVVPPLDDDATCLRCIELHRCDRDGGRASVLAQTTRPPAPAGESRLPVEGLTAIVGPGGPVRPAPTEPALLAAAAATAALVVAAYLSGDRLPTGVTIELTSPWPRLDHRRWTRHPHCPDHGAGRPVRAGGAMAGATAAVRTGARGGRQ